MWSDLDETRHPDAATEAWWWWGACAAGDAGVFVGFELRGNRFDYWAGLVRAGEPYLYVEELDGVGLRSGLEIKPAEMWADHQCEVPFRQWSLGNEAHGVLLDDPDEAWRRAYGTPTPVTFDIEWYATGDAEPIAPEPTAPGAAGCGYRQAGEVDCQIELATGMFEFVGPAERVHVWGGAYLPSSFAMPIAPSDHRAPYRRSDGRRVDQVLTDRWWVSVVGGRA
ncbi:unannotated protein [freshwater metagenome]|uniref:Unannotated protein n=1 Tax=freshwater metagenome TaxID=449393 RepID=A0A6J7F8A3_9ZZZZ